MKKDDFKELISLKKQVASQADVINSMRKRLEALDNRFELNLECDDVSEIIQYWVDEPIYEIDLRDFLPGDMIVFEPSGCGYSRFTITHKRL